MRVRSAADRLAVLDLAIRVFQTGHLMIVASTRSAARTVARALRAGRAEPVRCFIRQPTRSDVGIQVGTAGSLDPTVAGVVVFADATQVLHERVRRDVSASHASGSTGCSTSGDLGRRERLVIEGYVGPVIGRLGRAGRRPGRGAGRLRRLARRRAAGQTDRTRMEADVDLGNRRRNEATARLAAALAEGDVRTPWAYGLFLDGDPSPPSSRRSSGRRPGRVARARPRHRRPAAGMGRAVPAAGRPSATAGDRMRPGKIATDRPGQRS